MNQIKINISPLYLPLKTSFKQASSVRNMGESIWVTATRNDVTGFGEGCPRTYVTGENVTSCLEWLKPQLLSIEMECMDLADLKHRMDGNVSEIDKNPAAWCAIETALLDLFAKEKGESVEKLLGLENPTALYQYTAILGDSDRAKYEQLIERYMKWGFKDFKIKLNGDLREDQLKLEVLKDICEKAGVKDFRIRLDANNLWSGEAQTAIDHLVKLTIPFIGIEEPVEPKNSHALSEISTSIKNSIILDESLCNTTDLEAYDELEGQFIANIKVSRVGGILRSLNMIEALKKRNWKIIIGAHVGETSVLTRAGMCAVQAAGEHLIAHEGGFGKILLENDPVKPSLKFGARGQLDLRRPYTVETESGNIKYPPETWNYGWGLR